MNGVPVSANALDRRGRGTAASDRSVGHWESGLYFVAAASGRTARRLRTLRRRAATHRRARVAVVLPTLTWQAYNFRDDDGDGTADSWYARQAREHASDSAEPYLTAACPYGFRYHLGS